MVAPFSFHHKFKFDTNLIIFTHGATCEGRANDRIATLISCHACQLHRGPLRRRTFRFRTFPQDSQRSVSGTKKCKRFSLTENRLEGLLVPVPDDIHTSVDNRTPEMFRARSTGPILSPGYDVTRRDVPHSTRRLM